MASHLPKKFMEYLRKGWVQLGILLSVVLIIIEIYQFKDSLNKEKKQTQIKISKLMYQVVDLLGAKRINDGYRFTMSKGKSTIIPESDKERLEKVRRIIDEIEYISDGNAEIGQFKIKYYYELGDFVQLEKLVNETIQPEDKISVLTLIAMLYANTSGLEHVGFSYMEKALKVVPDSLALLHQYGTMLHANKKDENAIVILEQALALSPLHDATIQLLTHVYSESGNMDKAIVLLVGYHSAGKEMVNSRMMLGQLYAHHEKYKLAIAEYKKGLLLLPQSADLHYALSLAYSKTGEEDKSKEHKVLFDGYKQITSNLDETISYD